MNNNEEEAEIVKITHILDYACDKYFEGFLKKCESDIRNWTDIFKDILVNICYYNNIVSCDNLNFKIVPYIKLIHIYLCDFIYKLVNDKYTNKKECIKYISEIKRLIKIVKRNIKCEDMDKLSSKIDAVSKSKQIISTVKYEYQDILTIFDNYIKFYVNQNEKSEIFINPECLNSLETFYNFLDSITDKWMEENSLFDSNSNLKLTGKDKKCNQNQNEIKKELNDKTIEFDENEINQPSQSLIESISNSWDENEVFNLITGVIEFGVSNWKKILDKYQFNNRTIITLRVKYYQIIKKYPHIIDQFDKLNENDKREYIQSIYESHTFKEEEINYLKEGIKKFGVGKWKQILNNYKFKKRTPQSLLGKYKLLIRNNPNFFKFD